MEFLPQLALYRLAAQQILDIRPRTGVCLLAAGAAVRWFGEDELAHSLQEMGIRTAGNLLIGGD